MRPDDESGFTTYDAVGLTFSGICLMWTAVAELYVAPLFLKMFADFNSRLPTLTLLCVTWWFPAILGLLPLALTLASMLSRAPRDARLLTTIAAVLLTLMAPAIFLLGMYMPLWSIAGTIE